MPSRCALQLKMKRFEPELYVQENYHNLKPMWYNTVKAKL